MKFAIIILLVALTCTDGATLRKDPMSELTKSEIQNEFFNERTVVYRGQHDIVKICTPVSLMQSQDKKILFFVEADTNSDGNKIYKGLYVMVNNTTKKLLDQGRDMDEDGLGNVYLAAIDGLYKYNIEKSTAEKFGPINGGIISLAVENNTGIIYAVSETHELYQITKDGMKANLEARITGVQEIAMDKVNDHLYYYDANKNGYIVANRTTTKIKGLPENPHKFKMIKAPIFIDGMFFIVNNDPYIAYANGTSTILSNQNDFIKIFEPTAYSLEAGLLLYYGREKKIYEYNLVEKIFSKLFEKLSSWIKEKLQSF